MRKFSLSEEIKLHLSLSASVEYWVLVIQCIFTIEETDAVAEAFKVLFMFMQW